VAGFTIAVTGKGGVGKTTVAALCVLRLIARGRRPVLAVDADPNRCLDAALGVSATRTLGTIREEARELSAQGLSAGISKQELLELKIAETLVEADDFDLIAMGRPEGPGCYCYANNVLKQVLLQVSESYPYVVIDNEAGLENLSRRIVQEPDLLVMVTDPSERGFETILRLFELAQEMKVGYRRLAIVVNRLRTGALPERATALGQRTGASQVVGIANDPVLGELSEAGQSLVRLDATRPIVGQIDRLLAEAGPGLR
jgi:CO dehydrogenase maturation factor